MVLFPFETVVKNQKPCAKTADENAINIFSQIKLIHIGPHIPNYRSETKCNKKY
jgi:hypothetical protein